MIWLSLLTWWYPILFLWAHNLGQVSGIVVWQMLGISSGICAGLLVIFSLLWKSKVKACWFVSGCGGLFFSYGHVQSLFHVPHLLLSGGWVALMCGWGWWVKKNIPASVKQGLENDRDIKLNIKFIGKPRWELAITAILGGLCLVNGFKIGQFYWQYGKVYDLVPDKELVELGREIQNPPDVYYLIFDRYANLEVLKDNYGYDNSPFLDNLRNKGFVVVDQAYANYHKTTQSLASSLNMVYLDELVDKVGKDNQNWLSVERMIEGNRVQDFFRKMGYEYIHLGSGWDPTYKNKYANENININRPSEFGLLVYRTSWLGVLTEWGWWDLAKDQDERLDYQFEYWEEIVKKPGPTFTFGHFLLPHPPYIYDKSGRLVDPKPLSATDQKKAYLEQLEYANKVILDTVEVLMTHSSQPPIVVIQADEGPFPPTYEVLGKRFNWETATLEEIKQKLGILLAIYYPEPKADGVTPESPVNIFRSLFKQYYGLNLEILEDRYFVTVDDDHPYSFIDVSEEINKMKTSTLQPTQVFD